MPVSVLAIRAVIAELARRGIPPSSLLEHDPIPESELSDMCCSISASQCARLLERAMKLSGDPGLGLSVGFYAPERTFQLVAHLALTVPTAEDAIAVLAHYAPLLASGLQFSLGRDRDRAVLRYDFHDAPHDASYRFGIECVAASCVRLVFQHFAPYQHPIALRFRYAEPHHVERYRTRFGCEVSFGQRENALDFEAAILPRRQSCADRSMEQSLRKAADRMLRQKAPPTYAERVRAVLRREPDLCNPDGDRIALALGVNLRGLRRRLAREGVSWNTLLEEVQSDIARRELQRPEATVREVAERLGYSEPRAFYRAFKRWTGETPKTFRESRGVQ